MSTFIVRFDEDAEAPGALRVAIKDAIDLAGVPTTAGCAAVADTAEPAPADAACLTGTRAAQARDEAVIVGKTNLHELCFGVTGINPWYGTPLNPLDRERIPGGSSSGSAVAVASGAADIGFGTDTGGSVRIPAACCGLVGLKTTWGRIPLDGVWPLSASLDTVGPLAGSVDDVERGMALLEPGFRRADRPASSVLRLRIEGVEPAIEEAVDGALRAAGLEADTVALAGWADSLAPFLAIITGEAYRSDRAVLERAPERIGADVRSRLDAGSSVSEDQLDDARAAQEEWCAAVAATIAEGAVLALPTLPFPVPRVARADEAMGTTRLTPQFNLARTPAITLPVPGPDALPSSLQLVGRMGAEELLVATAAVIEAALA